MPLGNVRRVLQVAPGTSSAKSEFAPKYLPAAPVLVHPFFTLHVSSKLFSTVVYLAYNVPPRRQSGSFRPNIVSRSTQDHHIEMAVNAQERCDTGTTGACFATFRVQNLDSTLGADIERVETLHYVHGRNRSQSLRKSFVHAASRHSLFGTLHSPLD